MTKGKICGIIRLMGLAFAVAAHLESDILIADEVIAVGDAAFQKKALGKTDELSTGQGRTVLFVSHNMNQVKSLCSKGIVLEKGRLIRQDDNIYDSVTWYLCGGGEGPAKNNLEWEGSVGNSEISIKKISVRDGNGSIQCEFCRNDRIIVCIEYEIFIKRNDYVFCVFLVNSSGSIIVEVSAQEVIPEQYDDMCKVGIHRISLIIDSSIIGKGEYYLKFDMSIRNEKTFIEELPVISVFIHDVSSDYKIQIPRRSNVLSPNWLWSHEVVEKG